MSVICVFGDSTTWGAWDFEKSGWVNRLRFFLEKESYAYDVYNLGVSGDNTSGLLKRLEVEARAREPKIIIFEIGDNDAIYQKIEENPLVPLWKFEENLQRLIEIAKRFTSNIIFLGLKKVDENKTTPVLWEKTLHYTNKSLKKYDSKIKEIAKQENVSYIEMFDLLDNENESSDGLHPNSNGHEKIFQKVKNYLIANKLIV